VNAEPEASERVAGPITVAIVDDHRMLLQALEEWVRTADAGMEVVAAVPSWAELLAHPRFPADVVLLDLDLGDGLDVRMKIRMLGTVGAKTIVISTHSRRSVVSAALDAGASGYLVKSESTETIIDAIRAAHAGTPFTTERLDAILSDPGGPRLSDQERRVISLYSSGHSMKQVARMLNITEKTARAYLRHARDKYRTVGIDLGSKLALRARAIEDELIDRPTS
jgi:DNA-binding NarL/FixJ family response regulator